MTRALKQAIRLYLLPILYHLRIFDLLVRMSRRPFVIVMYHGVREKSEGFGINSRHLPLRDFRAHLRFFSTKL